MLVRIVKRQVHDVCVFPLAQQIKFYRNLVMSGIADYCNCAVLIQQEVVRNCLGLLEPLGKFCFCVLAELQ